MSFWTRDDEGRLTFPGGPGGYQAFVETGTQAGLTLLQAAATFPLCRSIELDTHVAARLQAIFRDQPGVELYTGDSGEELWVMIDDLAEKKVCFWLDAHAVDATTKENQCPLLRELEAIAHMDWKHTPLILIDDAPCFGAKEPMFPGHIPSQWPGMGEVIFTLGPRWTFSVEGKVIVCSPSSQVV